MWFYSFRNYSKGPKGLNPKDGNVQNYISFHYQHLGNNIAQGVFYIWGKLISVLIKKQGQKTHLILARCDRKRIRSRSWCASLINKHAEGHLRAWDARSDHADALSNRKLWSSSTCEHSSCRCRGIKHTLHTILRMLKSYLRSCEMEYSRRTIRQIGLDVLRTSEQWSSHTCERSPRRRDMDTLRIVHKRV